MEKFPQILENVKKRVQFSYIEAVTPIQEPGKLFELLKPQHRDAQLQILDAGRIAGSRHMLYAWANALAAFKGGYNISRNIAVEFLLFASTRKQINEAIRCVGVSPRTRNLLLVTFDSNSQEHATIVKQIVTSIGGRVLDNQTFEKATKDKLRVLRSVFQLSRTELEASSKKIDVLAVENLILERMAVQTATR
ncbi:MAG: KEOPS complex subunit Cgi121 [Candidatus Bathyarchaeia archaeon]